MLTTTIDQFKQAANGWKNLLVKNDQAELLFQQRSDNCNRCEHKTPLTCGLCGCPLAAKLRAVEAGCPDKRWQTYSRLISRFKRLGDNLLDENYFPVLWREDAYRTPQIDNFLND